MLALADPEPLAFWQFFLSAAAVVHVVVMLLKGAASWKQIKAADKPLNMHQPFMVERAKEYTQKQDHDALRVEFAALSKLITANHSELSLAAVRREASIKSANHRDITRVAEAITEKIDAHMRDAYHRINEQGERIAVIEGVVGITGTQYPKE